MEIRSGLYSPLCLNQKVTKGCDVLTCTRYLNHIGAHSNGVDCWVTDEEKEAWFQAHNVGG